MHKLIAATLPLSVACAIFRAPQTGRVTAGIFDDNTGRLVRQLPLAAAEAGGRLSFDCAAKDAAGVLTPCAPGLSVRAFLYNVSATWEGAVGMTSMSWGPSVFKSMEFIKSVSVAGGVLAYGYGYNEAFNAAGLLLLNATDAAIPLGHAANAVVFSLVATDGDVIYLANTGQPGPVGSKYAYCDSFVVAYDAAGPRCEHNFTAGGSELCSPVPWLNPCTKAWDGCGAYKGGYNNYWSSVLDYAVTPPAGWAGAPTGLAVQPRGVGDGWLAVAHGDANETRLFDKRSGARGCTLAMPAPAALAFDADGRGLWAVTAAGVARYPLAPRGSACVPGAAPTLVLGPAAVQAPGAIAVHPDPAAALLAAADLATAQVRLFNSADGSAAGVLGKAGGYSDGNGTLDASKFWFGDGNGTGAPTTLSFDEGGFLWVGDPGNRRVLRLHTATGAADAAATVSFLPRSYVTAARAVPGGAGAARVFSNFLELAVPAGPLTPNGWSLVRNWGAGLPAGFSATVDDGTWSFSGFVAVAAVPGAPARTVGQVNSYTDAAGASWDLLVELADGAPPYGAPALVPLLQLPRSGKTLHDDGSLRWHVDGVGAGGLAWQEVWSAPCALNASGWPAWNVSAPTLLARLNATAAAGPGAFVAHDSGVPARFPLTANGSLVVLLDGTARENAGPHLGAVPVQQQEAAAAGSAAPAFQEVPAAATTVAWTASPWGAWETTENVTTFPPYDVPVPMVYITAETQDGRYGANTSINYAASYALAAGGAVLYGFYGEAWHDGEANQWLLFDGASGLFLSQFGVPNMVPGVQAFAIPGAAGNAFSPVLLLADDSGTVAHLYHNDESAHSGVHRWRIELPGSSLHELQAEAEGGA